MRASSWSPPRLRGWAAAGLALSALTVGACGDLPSSGPNHSSVREGDLVSASGLAELATQSTPGAERVVQLTAPWRASATMQRGIAVNDMNRSGTLSQSRTRGEDADDHTDERRQQALGELGARMIPALAVDANSRLAAFGRTSVIEDSIADGHGRFLHFVAVSDLKRGPLTDYLIVRDGHVLSYQRVSWNRSGDIWRPVQTRSWIFAGDGSSLQAVARVTSLAASDVDTASGLAGIAQRLEEIEFGALARRFALPVAAHAQAATGTVPDIRCDEYRRTNVPFSGSNCMNYMFNKLDGLLLPAITAVSVYFKGLNAEALALAFRTGGSLGLAALLDGIVAAGVSLTALDWAVVAAMSVIIYASYHLVTCASQHAAAVSYCQKRDPRPSGGDGSSGGAEANTGLDSDACSMACDPSRRGVIDDWRAGIRAES